MAVDILATSDDERFLRWVEWLHGITDETFTLFHHRHLWGELAEISRNAALPPSAIFDAFGTWYGASRAVAGCKPVKKYVDKVVAHTDEERLQNLLTYRELNDAAGTLGKLLQKYTSLLKATVVELTPVIQHDWKAPFRKSWLPPL